MLAFSVKSKYGLAAVLALASHPTGGPLHAKTIAAQYKLPQQYLEQLLLDLKKSGIVRSIRGCQGGYTLAKPPEDLTVMDILSCLEGPSEFCDGTSGALGDFWRKKDLEIKALFQVSIAQLVLEDQKARQLLAYSI